MFPTCWLHRKVKVNSSWNSPLSKKEVWVEMMNYLLPSSFATKGRGWSDGRYHYVKIIWIYWHLRGIISLFGILWKDTVFSVIPFLKHVSYQPWLSLQHMLVSMGHLFHSQRASNFVYRLLSPPKFTLSEGKGEK